MFEHTGEFRYLGWTTTRKKGIEKEIQPKSEAGNACYFLSPNCLSFPGFFTVAKHGRFLYGISSVLRCLKNEFCKEYSDYRMLQTTIREFSR